jgi:hypothetical protein
MPRPLREEAVRARLPFSLADAHVAWFTVGAYVGAQCPGQWDALESHKPSACRHAQEDRQ